MKLSRVLRANVPVGDFMKHYKIITTALLVCFLCTGCAAKITADISSYGDTPITISGLTDKEFTVTPNDLAKLRCVQLSASGKTAKAGNVSAVGPLLDTFLAKYGKKLTDFKVIRFIARDQYTISLTGEYLTNYKIVMSLCAGKNPLAKNMQPMRLFIPGAESSYWIYAVVRIEFIPA
jgi:hypothetical protein